MRVRSVLLIAALVGAVAACDDSPTDPSPTDEVFTAQLAPANEVPPVSNTEASGSGTVTITMRVTRNAAGSITAATADFQVSLTGFPPATALTMSHIHAGAVGVNGGIVVDTGLTPGEVTLANGTGSYTKNGISVTAQTAQDILNNPGSFYFNVHSVLNMGGMARGQLVRP